MRKPTKFVLTGMSALSLAACNSAGEDASYEEATDEEAVASVDESEAAASQDEEVFEVCDGDGNRYASEAEAEAAGLEMAEYGATYCDYIE